MLHNRRADGSDYPVDECPICSSYRYGLKHLVDDEVFIRKDGSSFSVEYRTNPVFDDSGRLEGAVVTFRDISERKRIEQGLHQQLGELEHFNRLAVGRELRMLELKREVNELLAELGRAAKYRPDAADRADP